MNYANSPSHQSHPLEALACRVPAREIYNPISLVHSQYVPFFHK